MPLELENCTNNNNNVTTKMDFNTKIKNKKWIFLLLILPFLVLFSLFTSNTSKSSYFYNNPFDQTPLKTPQFVESKLKISPLYKNKQNPLPKIAYLISGSRGDGESLKRTLKALYHPLNEYVVHLDLEAPADERLELIEFIESENVFKQVGNVRVIAKSNLITYRGPTMVSNTLHAMAILLKDGGVWDWFINLSASDYPLITQDDLAHVFSTVSRDLNFIDHTSELGWKEEARIRPIIVDPSIYLARRSQIFTATQKRPTPAAFKVFTGSPWVTLSRSFLEYSLFGWDNLPRTVLMYFNNAILPQEGYFHSVVCNAPEFSNTTVNNDLRFMTWDSPPKMEPHYLGVSDFDQMIQSGGAFARQFRKDDPVLAMIDEKILHRRHNRVAPGSWCSGRDSWFTDACSQWGDINLLKPGPQAKRFADSMTNYIEDLKSQSTQCK